MRGAEMQYTVVNAAEAATIREGAQPQWRAELLKGQMLLMDKRPNWSAQDRQHTGMTLKSRAAGEGKVYVWAVPVTQNVPVLVTDEEEDPLDAVQPSL